MADNVVANPGVGGVTFATDDISSVQYPRSKMSLGADGSATDAVGGTGVDGAGVQRVSLATDVALPAGANALGTVGVTSVVPGTGATSLGKAEDAAHTSGDVGVMALAVRNDSGNVLAGSDGDYVPITVDSSGALRVDINGTVSTNNSSTAVLAGGAVFTGTSDDCLNYNEIRITVIASHASATDGLSIQQSSDNSNWDITDTYTIPATTGKTYSVPRQARYFRIVYTNGATLQTSFRLQTILNRLGARVSSQRPNDAYSNETDLEQQQSFPMLFNGTTWDRQRGDTTNGLDVDVTRVSGNVAVTLAAGAAAIAKAEDVASADADVGVPAMAVRKASPANTSGTDGDYEMLQMSAGRLWGSSNIDQVGGTNTVSGGVAGTLAVGGNVATNVAIGTNPVNLGAQAISAENAAVTALRMAQLVTDLVGKLIVLPYANPENFVSGVISSAMTGTTSTSLIAAPASGLRNYITQITVSNSHATVGTDIVIQDGSGGTTLYVIPAAAVFGGATLTFPVPLRQPTTATAIFCANVTTGANTKVSASGYKGI